MVKVMVGVMRMVWNSDGECGSDGGSDGGSDEDGV